MRYYETKIGKIIEQEFDTRVESVVFIYIMDKGIERIKRITDEDIVGIGYHEICICEECAAELWTEPQYDYTVKFVEIAEE